MNLIDKFTNFFKNSFGLDDATAKEKANEIATVASEAIQKSFDAKLDEVAAKNDYVSRETYDTLQERVSAMQNSLERMQNDATSEPVDITPFENKLKDLETENNTLKEAIESNKETFATLNADIATLKKAVGTKQIEAVKFASDSNGASAMQGNESNSPKNTMGNFFTKIAKK